MKKLMYLIVLVLILGLVLTGCSLLSNIGQAPATEQSGITYLTKGTEDVPDSFPLYAGQHDLVGNVLVWDDGTELCVKYQLSEEALAEGWLLYETHLAVGKVLSDIPQTKKNNPIPGQFLYGNDKLEGEKAWEICIPFDELWDETLFIAAHAVIKKTECETISGVITPELTWSRSSEGDVVAVSGLGASWNPAVQLLMATPLIAENEVWDGGTIGQYFTDYSDRADVQWASWPLINTGSTDLRLLKATFNLDANVAANITSAVLRMPDFSPDAIPINDNVYIFLNSSLQFWGGTGVEGAAGSLTTFEGMDGVPAIATYEVIDPYWGGLDLTGWYIAGEFPDLDIAEFVAGANTLDVFTEENNEGGGIAKLELVLGYEYQQECTTTESETAWAADKVEGEGTIQFDGANWATYFNYTVQEMGPVVSVGYDATAVLKAAVRYRNFNNGGGGEIYLGLPDLGSGVNRVENDFYGGVTCDSTNPYGSWQASNRVKFWYVPTGGKIYSRVTASHDYCLEYSVSGLDDLNYLQIDVVNRAVGTTVNLENVTLNGALLDNFVGVGWKTWQVTGIDLSGGFTLEGDIVLAGSQPGGENNKVQLTVGYLAP